MVIIIPYGDFPLNKKVRIENKCEITFWSLPLYNHKRSKQSIIVNKQYSLYLLGDQKSDLQSGGFSEQEKI